MADDLLARLSTSSDSIALRDDVRAYLDPVLSVGSRGKENSSKQSVATLAKRHVPFLAQLLKQCSSAQSARPGDDALDDISASAIDALALLRSALKGRPLEIEIQRYGLVRKLVSKKRYGDALGTGWTLYRELCAALGDETKPKIKKKADDGALPPPKEGVSAEVCNLVVGAVLNLLLCSVEGEGDGAALLGPMVPLVGQLDPWIAALGADAAQKHRDSMFRYLYKGSLRLAGEAASDHAAVPCAEAVVGAALRVCLLSPSRDRFPQVAAKVCGSLPPAAAVPALCGALDALGDAGAPPSSHGAVLPLLDALVRSCAAGGGGWAEAARRAAASARFQAWAEGPGSLPLAGAYLAALEVGAQAAGESAPRAAPKRGGGRAAAPRGLELLAGAESAAGALSEGACPVGEAPGALRALDALRRQVAALVAPPLLLQEEGGGHGPADALRAMGWDGAACARVASLLEAAPRVLARAAEAAGGGGGGGARGPPSSSSSSSSSSAGPLDSFRLPAASALVAASRLRACGGHGALLGGGGAGGGGVGGSGCGGGVCDPAAFFGGAVLGGDGGAPLGLKDGEVRWVAGAMHNLGVELFKLHRYAEGVAPLRVAAHAAGRRAGAAGKGGAGEGGGDEAAAADAASKCSALASCLARAGEPASALAALAEGLVRWGGGPASRPLARSYAKLLAEEGVLALPPRDTCLPLLMRRGGGGGGGAVGAGEACEEVLRQGEGAAARASPAARARLAPHLAAMAAELLGDVYTADRHPVRRARALLLCERLGVPVPAGSGGAAGEALAFLEAAVEEGEVGEDRDLSGWVPDLCALAHVSEAARAASSGAPAGGGEAAGHHVARAAELWSRVADSLPEPPSPPAPPGGAGRDGEGEGEEDEGDEGEAAEGCTGRVARPRASCEALLAAADMASLLGRPAARGAALSALSRLAPRAFARLPSALAPALCARALADAGCHAVCVSGERCPDVAGDQEEEAEGCAHGPACDGGEVGVPCAVAELRARAAEAGRAAGRARPASLLRRAALHQRASERALRAGALGAAHADAQEALRLRSRAHGLAWGTPPPSLPSPPPPAGEAAVGPPSSSEPRPEEQRDEPASSPASPPPAPAPAPRGGVRYPSPWRVTGEYLGSLVHLGRVMDLLGMGDEAVAVAREAAQVAGSAGAPLAEAAALELLARLQRRRRRWADCEEAAAGAEAALASARGGGEGGGACQACTWLLAARVGAVRGDMARRRGDCRGAAALYSAAEAELRAGPGGELGTSGSSGCDDRREEEEEEEVVEEEEEPAPRRGGRRGAGAKDEPPPRRGRRQAAAPPPAEEEGGEVEAPPKPAARRGAREKKGAATKRPAPRAAQGGASGGGGGPEGGMGGAPGGGSGAAGLLAHILVQRAKCHVSRGDDGAARGCLEEALRHLHGGDAAAAARVAGGDRAAAARPGLPLEQAAVLLHLGRIALRASSAPPPSTSAPRVVLWGGGPPPPPPSKGRSSRAKAPASARSKAKGKAAEVGVVALEGALASAASLLLQALALCREAPLLLRPVASALRELYGPAGQARAAWAFHDMSLGASVRQLNLTVTHGKLAACERAGGASTAAAAEARGEAEALRTVCSVLRVPAPEPAGVAACADRYVEAAASAVPEGTALCSVGSASGAEVPGCGGEGGGGGGEWLLLCRLEAGGGGAGSPLLARIPVLPPPLGAAGPGSAAGEPPPRCGCGAGGGALGPGLGGGVGELRAVLAASAASMDGSAALESRADKTAWWQGRLALDGRMRALLETIQGGWLGPWRCLLAGGPTDPAEASRVAGAASELAGRAGAAGLEGALRALVGGVEAVGLTEGEVTAALGALGMGGEDAGDLARSVVAESGGGEGGRGGGRGGGVRAQLRFEDEAAASAPGGGEGGWGGAAEGRGAAGSRHPVVLVSDPRLQGLPWESLPALRSPAHRAYYRMPSLGCARALRARRYPGGGGPGGAPPPPVDLGHTFFLLNPSGDLGPTQDAFQGWFAGQAGWEGTSGVAPTADEYADALSGHDLLIYFGHGGGEQFLPPARLRRLDGGCAAALLMGCSSGRLADQGDYEPTGVALAYLVAGSPAALANLWDVTDRDIDRFSRAVLEGWMQGGGGEQGGAPGDMAAPVGEARGVCRLPNLIGAAPVCYGVPTPIVQRP